MPFLEEQPIYQYFQPWDKVKEAVFGLEQWATDKGAIEVDQDIGGWALSLAKFVRDGEATEEFPLSKTEKRIIGLLDVDLVQGFLKTNVEEAANEKLAYQLRHIAIVLGFFDPIPVPYEAEEIGSMYVEREGTEDYDFGRYLRTLKEGTYNEENLPLIKAIKARIGYILNPERKFSWDEMLILILVCEFSFSKFAYLDPDNQKFVLQNFFYRAIAVGTPVREAIEAALYEMRDVLEFTLTNKRFFEAIDTSFEYVPLQFDLDSEGELPQNSLQALLQGYMVQAGDDFDSEELQKGYVSNVYANTDYEPAKAWLKQALYIYTHLRNGDLIKETKGEEYFIDELVARDTLKLLSLFSVGRTALKDLVEYFKSEEKLVSVPGLINRIKENLDLSSEVSVKRVLEFTKALQEADLFPKDKDIIEFYESDGKFHWVD